MATEKRLNTRILLRYDEYTNWYNNNPKLLKGEVAIATIPENHTDPSTGAVTQIPAVVMKVGTGAETGSNYRDLPFVSAKAADVLAACKSEDSLKTFVNSVIADADMATNEKFTELSGKVDTLNGDENTAGSVAKAIKDAIDALDLANTYVGIEEGKSLMTDAEHTKLAGISEGANKVENVGGGKIKIDGTEVTVYEHPATHTVAEISDFDEKVKTYGYATKTEAQGYADAKDEAIAAAKKAGDDAQAAADAKVASVAAGDTSVTVAGTTTTPTVAVKLDPSADNAIKLNENGLKVEIGAAPEYTIVKAADSGDYAAVYNLTKDGTIVGASINIPKDMVVKSGSVVGDEIILVLNDEAATEIKIPVSSLIEYVTSGSATGDMVVINVSDDHKVTATITDGTITLAKLTTEVQTAIGQAHSHENKSVLDGITADKVNAWDGAEAAAKSHADGLNSAMNTRVEALEAIDHEHANKELLDTYKQTEADLADAVAKKHSHSFSDEVALNGITAAKVTAWDAAEQNAKDYADGLAGNYATAEQGGKADTALQEITTTANGGLKVTNKNQIDIDDSITFIFDCGDSSVTA